LVKDYTLISFEIPSLKSVAYKANYKVLHVFIFSLLYLSPTGTKQKKISKSVKSEVLPW